MYKSETAEIFCLLQTKLSCDSVRGGTLTPLFVESIFHVEIFSIWNLPPRNSRFARINCVQNSAQSLQRNMWTGKGYIKLPNDDDQATVKVHFYEYGNFPGSIGCTDKYWAVQESLMSQSCVHSHYAVLQHWCTLKRFYSIIQDFLVLLFVRMF